MGDSMSWAADQEEDRWLASPEYVKREALRTRFEHLRGCVDIMPVGRLSFQELQFLLNLKRIDPDGRERLSEGVLKRIEGIVYG